jgi:hypothetical protein
MAKNPNNKAAKRDEPMNVAMKFFLAGCVAELYLLIVRRFYVNGTVAQMIAWDSYLVVLGWIGVAVLALGALLTFLWKADKKRVIGCFVGGAGAFLALASFLPHHNMSTLTLLLVVVPVVMLLGILWSLYDRECAVSLTVLGVTLIALWVCKRVGSSIYVGTYVKVAVVVYIVVLAALAALTKQGKLKEILPASADPLPVYVACGLSVIALLAALVSTTAAYYAMWGLAFVVFGLAVYYTVKQL